jgi:hypothetical protein
MANDLKNPAEGAIAKAERQADGRKAMADYEAAAAAVRAKTERLRELRLARDEPIHRLPRRKRPARGALRNRPRRKPGQRNRSQIG